MYEIKAGNIEINDVEVDTFRRNVKHVNTSMTVEAGSTGFRGYVPREKSSRGYMSIYCKQGDFHFDPITDKDGTVRGIEIVCCGDNALMALIDTLEFARDAIEDECD